MMIKITPKLDFKELHFIYPDPKGKSIEKTKKAE
jgi:hypothetical protein